MANKKSNKSDGKDNEMKSFNRTCVLTYKVFNGPDGKKLLENLKTLYLEQPVSYHEWTERKSCFREGENNTIRGIITMFNRGMKLMSEGSND